MASIQYKSCSATRKLRVLLKETTQRELADRLKVDQANMWRIANDWIRPRDAFKKRAVKLGIELTEWGSR